MLFAPWRGISHYYLSSIRIRISLQRNDLFYYKYFLKKHFLRFFFGLIPDYWRPTYSYVCSACINTESGSSECQGEMFL